jgi:two-component system sensor histidine kinase CiaH
MTIPYLTVKSARTRLMLTYLSIIMFLSIGYSILSYFQLMNEARGNLQSQQVRYRDFLFFITPENVQDIQNQGLTQFKHNLIRRMAGMNLGVLIFGTVISYILARRSLRPMEEALATQSRFTSDAAHELRTPLTAMKTETEVALRSAKLPTREARAILKSNLEEIAKLETLTAGLLRLAHSSEKIDTSYWQDYKLSDVLATAHDRIADKADKRGIKLTLPKTKAVVRGDPDQLTELFVPLLGNAVKYSHDDGKVNIKVIDGDKLRVDIIDHGVGIADIDLPHIFKRFYRADNSRSRSGAEGYGLGLSLAEAIATTHGGEIKVKSKYGKGSTFSVYLPKAS